MRRLIALFVVLFATISTPAFAARMLLAAGGWNGYGAQNPINGGTGDFFGPYQINFPNCFAIDAIAAPPWDPNAVETDFYLASTNASTCAGGGAPNPSQGVYFRENAPHRGHDIVFWFRLHGNITVNTFILRLNDSTHGTNSGVYRGAIDYTAPFLDTSNKLNSNLPSDTGTSAALTLNAWNQIEYCYIAGINGSGTIPPDSKFWLNGTQFLTFGADTTSISGGGDTFTLDYELGAGGQGDFGPWMDFDPGTSCPGTAFPTFYYTAFQPDSNNSVQFSVNTAANNYQAVNGAIGANGYVFSATEGQQDVYNIGAFNFGLGTILGVTNRINVESDAPGDRVILPVYNNGSTTSVGLVSNGISLGGGAVGIAPYPYTLVNGTYFSITDTRGTSIFTGSAWTASELHAIGMSLVQ